MGCADSKDDLLLDDISCELLNKESVSRNSKPYVSSDTITHWRTLTFFFLLLIEQNLFFVRSFVRQEEICRSNSFHQVITEEAVVAPSVWKERRLHTYHSPSPIISGIDGKRLKRNISPKETKFATWTAYVNSSDALRQCTLPSGPLISSIVNVSR